MEKEKEVKEESLEDKKIKEFAEKISELQREYSGYCMLYAVNCMNQDWEIAPMIKIKKLK